MPLPPLYGHEGIRNRLVGAFASGRLPQALLFEGPSGVGKQRLALWLGQLLLCEAPAPAGPCGACRACRQVLGLAHPDLHWFVPVEVAKRGADADKQVDLVEEALGEELEARRKQPFYEAPSGLAAHGIASVRLLQRRLALTPVTGARKVVVVGDAERLVPQRSSPEAANALLKALEEPPADTTIVLTAADPEAVLPTILSRVTRLRVGRLPDTVVAAFCHQELKLSDRDTATRVALAGGRIGTLVGRAGGEEADRAAAAFLDSVRGGPARRYAAALKQPTYQARGAFTDLLDGLLVRLRAAASAGGDTAKLIEAIARTLDAREMAQGNVNPQLLAAVLADDLAVVP